MIIQMVLGAGLGLLCAVLLWEFIIEPYLDRNDKDTL